MSDAKVIVTTEEQLRQIIREEMSAAPRTSGEVLTTDEAAKLLGCTDNHVRNLAESGRLPAVDLRAEGATKHMWRFVREDVMAHLRKQAAEQAAARASGAESSP